MLDRDETQQGWESWWGEKRRAVRWETTIRRIYERCCTNKQTKDESSRLRFYPRLPSNRCLLCPHMRRLTNQRTSLQSSIDHGNREGQKCQIAGCGFDDSFLVAFPCICFCLFVLFLFVFCCWVGREREGVGEWLFGCIHWSCLLDVSARIAMGGVWACMLCFVFASPWMILSFLLWCSCPCCLLFLPFGCCVFCVFASEWRKSRVETRTNSDQKTASKVR